MGPCGAPKDARTAGVRFGTNLTFFDRDTLELILSEDDYGGDVTDGNRSLPPSFQVRSEGRKKGEPSENVHSRDAMTEPTWMYSRRFSEGSPSFLPGV
ncbi:MAG: hypothetical protein GY790_09520 [Bacteroidetes bacterium]|nr:hypothetical protein [Bacteroidota bacterium]